MSRDTPTAVNAVLERLRSATNDHDLEALADCFHVDYDSSFPAHPDRSFSGQEGLRANWSRIFASVPDLNSDLVRSAGDHSTAWAEWEWTGTRLDGVPFTMRGVTIQHVRDGKIDWVRLYMEPVERDAAANGDALRKVVGDAPVGDAQQQILEAGTR